MRNLYSVLGLSSGASDRQIKAAYRNLAKRLHPDVNAGDDEAEQRIKDINRAYEVLGDPDARAAYDRRLARRWAEDRRRFWRSAATGAGTFVVTSGVGLAAVLWQQNVPAPPPQTGKAPAIASQDDTIRVPAAGDATRGHGTPAGDTTAAPDLPPSPPTDTVQAPQPSLLVRGAPSPIDVAGTALPQSPGEGPPPLVPRTGLPAAAAAPLPPSVSGPASWTIYRSARFGFSLSYPAEVFAVAKGEVEEQSPTLVSPAGRARLRITAIRNIAGATLASYRRALIASQYADAAFDYAPQRGFWFVLSGTRGEEMFYERITLSCDRKTMHGWQLTYPATERAFYDPIIEAIHRSYRHGNGPGARCGEGKAEGTPPRGSQAAGPAPVPATAAIRTREKQVPYGR